ncbi:MAG: DUF6524 family protein [Gemmatimonas sp.]|jgi:hypothetical protein|uniref:DUF6524 family protein n=1 Tax=Gemmatimonas sp. TaxID=1962908 RepID=UPI00391EE724|nr:DUF6524 family protein [Gemmatimonadota bacterium]
MANGPGVGGIAGRALAALVLVFATYNPERVSYFHWAVAPLRTGEATSGPTSLKVLTGLALLGGWAVFLNATRRSIGLGGALLVLALSGGMVWLLIDFGVVSARSGRGITYVVLVCTALLLAVGMNWSHLSRKLSGQVDMDPSE